MESVWYIYNFKIFCLKCFSYYFIRLKKKNDLQSNVLSSFKKCFRGAEKPIRWAYQVKFGFKVSQYRHTIYSAKIGTPVRQIPFWLIIHMEVSSRVYAVGRQYPPDCMCIRYSCGGYTGLSRNYMMYTTLYSPLKPWLKSLFWHTIF